MAQESLLREEQRATSPRRRLPVGAEPLAAGGVHFRVWAPQRQTVEVVLEAVGARHGTNGRNKVALQAEGKGYYSGTVADACPGTLYRYRLDGKGPFPDPAARFQPQGPHGPSQVIDPDAFSWSDHEWRGVTRQGQVVYEMHIGTFTPEGTWEAAVRELPALAELGITVLEVMPLADFAAKFGWGYDGVDLFAPTRLYGTPDDVRRFVDLAHGLGLGVILDVVYNHLGPDGNYLKEFSTSYFTDRYKNEWGAAVNYDGDDARPVREFSLANAVYWIEEFHFDGLRLDATQQIFDTSADNIMNVLCRETRAAARGRSIYLVAENEPQQTRLVKPHEQGGYGLDALWNDDFHHSAMVALTGHNEAYYTSYCGTPQEFISTAKYGYLYQGQRYKWQKKRRGTPSFGLPPAAFVNYIQNHDQIANSGRGERCHQLTGPGRFRAMTALLLLAPGTPMLFQGEEFAASSPFYFFADHHPELGRLVKQGRSKFLSQFPTLATPEMQSSLADPGDPETFRRCKLDPSERRRHAWATALHRDLLRLRRDDPVFRSQRPHCVDGAVLGEQAFVLRFFGEKGDDRLLMINLGRNLHLDPAPEPLLAPPEDQTWELLWSSEHPTYGGCSTAPVESEENWLLPGEAAVVLKPGRRGSRIQQGP
jgi:maltooligosyltrehalose trehalohydrolase